MEAESEESVYLWKVDQEEHRDIQKQIWEESSWDQFCICEREKRFHSTQKKSIQGEKGEDGVGLKFDIVGLAKNLYLYNSQPRGFSYLAHDVPCIFVKLNERPNNWSRPIKLEFVND